MRRRTCIFSNHDPLIDSRVRRVVPPFTMRCDPDDPGRCVCDGVGCGRVRGVVVLTHSEALTLLRSKRFVAVSDRWCCDCGCYTTVYIVDGGSLLYLHDCPGYEYAHLVELDAEASRRLQAILDDTDPKLRYLNI